MYGEGKQIRINPLSTYEVLTGGPTFDDPYTLMFYLNVEDLQETRIISVVPYVRGQPLPGE